MIWSGVPRTEIDLYWPHVKPMFRDVIERSPARFNETKVVDGLKNGVYQLWVTHEESQLNCALVTEIVTYESGDDVIRNCRLQLLGGRNLRESWDLFEKVIVPWAIEKGCTQMTCFPRDGLARLLKKLDFKFVKMTDEGKLYFKDLTDDTRIH